MHTITLTQPESRAISLVGSIVTYGSDQYRVRSAEGVDWYAFQPEPTEPVTLDVLAHPIHRLTDPVLNLVHCDDPHHFRWSIPASRVHPGVCLIKSYR